MRRSGVRGHAAQGDLLGVASRLQLRARAALRHLPQRPLEDGRPARAALPRHRGAAGSGAVRIVVDRGLCQGHAMCELEAPEVFTAPSGGPVEVLLNPPPDEQGPAVRLAVQYCPTKALSIEED